eukprot:tig00020688_g12986.t1
MCCGERRGAARCAAEDGAGAGDAAPGATLTAVVVEAASEEDARPLAALDAATLEGMWTEGGYLEEVASSASDLIVMRAPGAGPGGALAAAACLFSVLGESSLVILTVEPSYQRQGFGAWLCALALQRALARGDFACYLEVRESNAEAQYLYGLFGFKAVGRRKGYYEDGEDAVTMMAVLTDPLVASAIRSQRERAEAKMAAAGYAPLLALAPAPEGGIPGYMHLSRGPSR